MVFRWLKSRLPRGLYGRAALILLLPIATLQLTLTFDFTQRYFTDVTQQLTESTALSLLALDETYQSGATGEAARLAETLQIDLQTISNAAVPPDNGRKFYDISGIQVEAVLREHFPDLLRVWLAEPRLVHLYLQSGEDVLQMSFSRKRVSPVNPHQFVVATFSIAALMAFIAAIFLRNQLRPIAELSDAAEAFGRGVSVPYRVRGATEVRAAGRAFLAMRARIERHIEQRTLMLTSISHDLRTPLTRLRLECAMLPPETGDAMVRDIEDMTRMIDGFLDFAREDATASPSEHIEIKSFLEDIIAAARRGGQNVTLVGKIDEQHVTGRATDLRRAIENLLSNAARYAQSTEVSVMPEGKALTIIVEDNGPGIAEQDLGRAVHPFERLDDARSPRHDGGAGLGLAIVADIARYHGGQLTLQRSAKLGGLEARFTIA